MDFVPESFGTEDNDTLVTYYLEAAYEAAIANQKKLAISLYQAAFEQASLGSNVPSDEVLDGMAIAWDMACDVGDTSRAESIFKDLMPYSSSDQISDREISLQKLACEELVQMGMPSELANYLLTILDSMETSSGSAYGAAQDSRDDADDGDSEDDFMGMGGCPAMWNGSLFGASGDSGEEDAGDDEEESGRPSGSDAVPESDIELTIDPDDIEDEAYDDDDDDSDEDDGGTDAGSFFGRMRGSTVEETVQPKKYEDLVGYDSELRQMCIYGFDAAGDQAYRRFIKQTSKFHGVDGLSLDDPFFFYGPSRDDVYEFAEATAGEIGNPVVSLHIRTDDEGMWTMRLSGPFKRGLFGVVDPTDVPMPCTFIIENVDLLQDFVRMSARSEAYGFDMSQQRSSGVPHGYNEILGYIHSMMSKPQVFAIATSARDIDFMPQLDELFDRVQKIEIGLPDFDERKAIWEDFSKDHASFMKIDLDELAEVSAGISRHDMGIAGRNAVRSAYKKSISNADNEFVEIKDVVFEMVPFVSEGNGSSAVEDAAAEAFANELEGISFEMSGEEDEGIDPSEDTSSKGIDPRLGDIGLEGMDDPEE